MNSVTGRKTIKNLANFTFIGNSTATWTILLAMLFDAEPERLVTTLIAVTAAWPLVTALNWRAFRIERENPMRLGMAAASLAWTAGTAGIWLLMLHIATGYLAPLVIGGLILALSSATSVGMILKGLCLYLMGETLSNRIPSPDQPHNSQ